jgi:hypothetical protein
MSIAAVAAKAVIRHISSSPCARRSSVQYLAAPGDGIWTTRRLLEQGAGFGGRPFCGFLQRPGRPAASSLSTLLSLAGAKNLVRLSLTLGSLTPLAGPLNDGPRVRRIGAREVYQIGIRQKSPAHRSSLSISPRKHREPKLDHDTVQAVGRALGDLFSIRRTVIFGSDPPRSRLCTRSRRRRLPATRPTERAIWRPARWCWKRQSSKAPGSAHRR